VLLYLRCIHALSNESHSVHALSSSGQGLKLWVSCVQWVSCTQHCVSYRCCWVSC